MPLQPIISRTQVLIVEDDDTARTMYATALTESGYQVRTAPDGLAGLRLLEAFEPDVVVLDLGLPIATGFDVLHELRAAARTHNTPVIAISGNDAGLKLAKANPEFFATIPKPFDPDTLVHLVGRASRQLYT